jgi:hypothetical protein
MTTAYPSSAPSRLFGNRCGHDPRSPRLSPPEPIKKGPGGLPRILSLAAERAKDWFFHPATCPLLQTNPERQTRSERREACQVVLEFLLSRLDLASLCVGTPTPTQGFIDLDMKTIVQGTSLGQRRCERAIGQLKQAGFLKVDQPRYQNQQGKYFGLRAIRVFTGKFFDWLGLGTMLKKERRRASEALKRKAGAAGKSLSDFMGRLRDVGKRLAEPLKPKPLDLESKRAWNHLFVECCQAGMEFKEAQRCVNRKLGYPDGWSPGQGRPERAAPCR